jgi:ketol-acid reductoisomerase
MLSSAVERLIHMHGNHAGKNATIIGTGARAAEISSDLRESGINIVAGIEPDAVLSALGAKNITECERATAISRAIS